MSWTAVSPFFLAMVPLVLLDFIRSEKILPDNPEPIKRHIGMVPMEAQKSTGHIWHHCVRSKREKPASILNFVQSDLFYSVGKG